MPRGKKSGFDDAFAWPLNEEKRYWAGMILADGSVKGTRIRLSLASRDRAHVVKFAAFVRSTNKIHHMKSSGFGAKDNKGMYAFGVRSKKMVADLERCGIFPRKTYGSDPIAPELAFDPDLWRGAVDGDGSITLGVTPMLTFCGTWTVTNQFANFVASITGRRPKIGHQESKPTLFYAAVSSTPGQNVLRLLYHEDLVEVLERKLASAKDCLRWCAKVVVKNYRRTEKTGRPKGSKNQQKHQIKVHMDNTGAIINPMVAVQ